MRLIVCGVHCPLSAEWSLKIKIREKKPNSVNRFTASGFRWSTHTPQCTRMHVDKLRRKFHACKQHTTKLPLCQTQIIIHSSSARRPAKIFSFFSFNFTICWLCKYEIDWAQQQPLYIFGLFSIFSSHLLTLIYDVALCSRVYDRPPFVHLIAEVFGCFSLWNVINEMETKQQQQHMNKIFESKSKTLCKLLY